jgi:hypothetical protein
MLNAMRKPGDPILGIGHWALGIEH